MVDEKKIEQLNKTNNKTAAGQVTKGQKITPQERNSLNATAREAVDAAEADQEVPPQSIEKSSVSRKSFKK